MTNSQEDIGISSDELESLHAAMSIPMPADFHLEQLQILLPKKIKALREALIAASGEDPWNISKAKNSQNSQITQLTDAHLIEIEQLAAVNYSYAEMALYLSMPKKLFVQEAKQKDSAIWEAIQRGYLKTQVDIDNKLAENAAAGNITAVQIYEKRTEAKRVENLKEIIFYGE